MENGIKLFIPVQPMGAVRTTQAQKFVDDRYKRYTYYKKQLGLYAKKMVKEPTKKPIMAELTFYMPIPSNGRAKGKKVNTGDYHMVRPDIDNLEKGIFDSLNKIVWYDDNQLVDVHCRKIYSNVTGIAIELWELNNDGQKTASLQQETTRGTQD